jgi:hypothetical protein
MILIYKTGNVSTSTFVFTKASNKKPHSTFTGGPWLDSWPGVWPSRLKSVIYLVLQGKCWDSVVK